MNPTQKAIVALFAVGVVTYTIGYRQGVRSMVREWTSSIAPDFATYLGAQDIITRLIDPDDKPSQ